MKKKSITQYLGYILFAIAAFMLIGMFNNTAKLARTSKYYEKEVYPKYQSYDQNNDYLDGYVTAGSGFYDKDPIYTYKQNDPAASDLEFSLNIYRARFTRTTYSLYFFKKQSTSDGFIIEIKDLKYKGTDIMDLNRPYDSQEIPANLFRVYLRFDPAVLPHVKESDTSGAYAYTLSPMYPAIVDKSLLQIDKDGTLAELIEIRIVHVPLDYEKKPIEDSKQTLFVTNSDGNKFYGDAPIYAHDLSLTKDKYEFSETEVKGTTPTEEEITALNLSYNKLNLSPYNGGVVLSTVIITVIVIIAAYFMFFNKLVVAKIQEKRAEKRLAAKQADSMQPSQHQEAIFEDIDDDSEVLDADFDDSEESKK